MYIFRFVHMHDLTIKEWPKNEKEIIEILLAQLCVVIKPNIRTHTTEV